MKRKYNATSRFSKSDCLIAKEIGALSGHSSRLPKETSVCYPCHHSVIQRLPNPSAKEKADLLDFIFLP